MRFGLHLPFSNGPQLAKDLGAQALQVFCGNPRGWKKTPLDPDFVRGFRAGLKDFSISPLVVHATYLINLAARDDRIYKLSSDGFAMEVARAAELGAQFFVVHIGNHMGAGAQSGRQRVGQCIRDALKQVPDAPLILVENTAGGGSTLGGTFLEIAAVMDEAATDHLGLCLDTCHALAAGYDVRTPDGVARTLDELDRTVGLKRLHCIHLNDSKGALGSHLDRHEHIGKGQIGLAGFRAFLADQRLWHLPVILETPKDDPDDDPRNLRTAISLAVKAGAPIDRLKSPGSRQPSTRKTPKPRKTPKTL